MSTAPRRPASSSKPELLDYEKFLSVLRDELDRSLRPLAEDLKGVSRDVKDIQATTYSREMMDTKLDAIHDQLKAHSNDLKGIHNLIGNSGKELLERLAVLASIAYALVYILPHFIH